MYEGQYPTTIIHFSHGPIPSISEQQAVLLLPCKSSAFSPWMSVARKWLKLCWALPPVCLLYLTSTKRPISQALLLPYLHTLSEELVGMRLYIYGGREQIYIAVGSPYLHSNMSTLGQLESLNGRTKTFFTLCRKNKPEWREQQYQSLCQVMCRYIDDWSCNRRYSGVAWCGC